MKVEIVNNLRNSLLKGIIWALIITVFAVRSGGFIIDCCAAFKCIDLENAETNDQAATDDFDDSCFGKTAKKLFPFFENGTHASTIPWAAPMSVHWCVYSFSIFKEPLRDVLTPPPNFLSA